MRWLYYKFNYILLHSLFFIIFVGKNYDHEKNLFKSNDVVSRCVCNGTVCGSYFYA